MLVIVIIIIIVIKIKREIEKGSKEEVDRE